MREDPTAAGDSGEMLGCGSLTQSHAKGPGAGWRRGMLWRGLWGVTEEADGQPRGWENLLEKRRHGGFELLGKERSWRKGEFWIPRLKGFFTPFPTSASNLGGGGGGVAAAEGVAWENREHSLGIEGGIDLSRPLLATRQ